MELIVSKEIYYDHTSNYREKYAGNRHYFLPYWLITRIVIISKFLQEGIIATNKNTRIYFNVRGKKYPPKKSEKYVQKLVYCFKCPTHFLVQIFMKILYIGQYTHIGEVEIHYKRQNQVAYYCYRIIGLHVKQKCYR